MGPASVLRGISAMLDAWGRGDEVSCALMSDGLAGGALAREFERLHAGTGFADAIVGLGAGSEVGRALDGVIEALGVKVRRIGSLDDLFAPGEARASVGVALPALDPSELIGRRPRPVNEPLIEGLVSGRRVLITGAGGSIGSELARVCARSAPAELILLDRSDNALFEIERQIASRFPELKRTAVLHDIVDQDATLRRFLALEPEVVLHAAAHKHVPLMEDHPGAAVSNNLFGTKSVADASLATGVSRMVMISTDKAVNPTSVMGATKRLAEHYVRSLNGVGETKFALVRFGNVLGSACSVIPVWTRQLSEGGPITVTHRDMTRYFMTIPEAAALVLQAAAIVGEPGAGGSDVFVLDMGLPLKVLDLAQRFVALHGMTPWVVGEELPAVDDGGIVEIVITGVRPGEKLYEELSYDAEELRPTVVRGALAWSGPMPDSRVVTQMISDLSELRSCQSPEPVIEALRRHVPEMRRRPVVSVVGGVVDSPQPIGGRPEAA